MRLTESYLRQLIREELGRWSADLGRDDDYDVLINDKRAWNALIGMRAWDSEEPEVYEWQVTQGGYIGRHPQYDPLHWDGMEWTIG